MIGNRGLDRFSSGEGKVEDCCKEGYQPYGSTKYRRISCLAAELLATQGLCSMGLVSDDFKG